MAEIPSREPVDERFARHLREQRYQGIAGDTPTIWTTLRMPLGLTVPGGEPAEVTNLAYIGGDALWDEDEDAIVLPEPGLWAFAMHAQVEHDSDVTWFASVSTGALAGTSLEDTRAGDGAWAPDGMFRPFPLSGMIPADPGPARLRIGHRVTATAAAGADLQVETLRFSAALIGPGGVSLGGIS